MYFKTMNTRRFNLKQWLEAGFFFGNDMKMLQIFTEFAWLKHVGIFDGLKKTKTNSRRLLNRNE